MCSEERSLGYLYSRQCILLAIAFLHFFDAMILELGCDTTIDTTVPSVLNLSL